MKVIENLNYRQWQKRNSVFFDKLTKIQQKEVKKEGYRNLGWNSVQKSWLILQKFASNIVNIFDYKLAKGDLMGAIDLAIIDTDKMTETAKNTVEFLTKNTDRLNKLAEKTLAKYELL